MTVAGAGIVDVTVPAEQSEGTEIVVSLWFRAVGDRVEANDPLLELSTDKVNVEVAAPASGTLVEILRKDGDKVEPGELVGRISVGDAAASSSSAATPAERGSSAQADGASKTPAL